MDPATRPDRRLAAIMATDVVGYSSLMQSDEVEARLRLENPSLRVSNINDVVPIVRPEDIAKWSEGMRLAGLLE
jgi:hypothetical protein